MTMRNSILRGFLLAFVVAMLSACTETPEGMVASAKEYLAKGDQTAAVIQLKNALQKNPALAEARFLLGAALLDTGEFPASEKELRKALELEYPADQVVPMLVRAMVDGGRYKNAIDEFGTASISSPQGTAELQSALGKAYIATGNTAAGKAAFEVALAARPDYPPAILGVARLQAAANDIPGALAAIDAALAKTPTFAEGWFFKGELLVAQGQLDGALAAFRRAIAAKPDMVTAHGAAVELLLADGKMEETAAQIEAMKTVAPKHPQTFYAQAAYAYNRKDFAAARDAVQQFLKVAPDNLRGLLLAGAVDLELNSFATAEAKLVNVLKVAPGHMGARRLLIATYLKLNQPAKALDTLKPVLGLIEKDPVLLTLAGKVYLGNGQPAEAAKYFAKVVAVDPKSAPGHMGLAVSHLAKGDVNAAFQELESAASESSGTQADQILIRSALARRQFDKALAAIDALEKKQPNTPVAGNLRGAVLLAKRDIAGARKSFEQALALDPAYFPAAANLARMDLADKKPEEAKKRFDAVLANNPKNVAALLAIAELRARSGGSPDEVAALIEKAISVSPTAPLPRLALIAHRMRTNDAKKATAAAQDALAALPNRPEILEALAGAQLASGETNQALATCNNLVKLQPTSPRSLLLLADAQVAAKDKGAALQTLRKALTLKPDLIQAQRAIVVLEADAGRVVQAVTMAREVQKQLPKKSVGYVLEGDVHAQRGAWNDAAASYRTGLKQVGTVDLAIKLHGALVAAGKAAEAERVASTWIKEHPNHVALRLYLAAAALAKNDYAAATRQYQALVAAAPNNAILLNDLAWSAGQAKDPKAIEYAERAYKLAPEQPAVLDTLGVLLVEKGDKARGIELLQKASKLAGASPSIRLNLAKALIAAGKIDAAKKELEELAKLGDKFKSEADVQALIKGI